MQLMQDSTVRLWSGDQDSRSDGVLAADDVPGSTAAIVLVACLAFSSLTFALGLLEAIAQWTQLRRDGRRG